MRSIGKGVVDVRVESTPASLDIPDNRSAIYAIRPLSVERGPVRLVIDLPSNMIDPRIVVAAAALVLVPLAYIGLTYSDPGTREGILYRAMVLVLPAAALWAALRAARLREQFEVDSRYVTLSAGLQRIALVPRREFVDVRLAPPPRRSIVRAWPTIVWGASPPGGPGFAFGFGSGISQETARELLSRIQQFCAEVPAE